MEVLRLPLERLVGEGRAVLRGDGEEIVVFRAEGELVAVRNACPHAGNPLAEGEVLGRTLTCAYHGWRFDLETGACLFGEEPLERFPVEVRDGVILISVS